MFLLNVSVLYLQVATESRAQSLVSHRQAAIIIIIIIYFVYILHLRASLEAARQNRSARTIFNILYVDAHVTSIRTSEIPNTVDGVFLQFVVFLSDFCVTPPRRTAETTPPPLNTVPFSVSRESRRRERPVQLQRLLPRRRRYPHYAPVHRHVVQTRLLLGQLPRRRHVDPQRRQLLAQPHVQRGRRGLRQRRLLRRRAVHPDRALHPLRRGGLLGGALAETGGGRVAAEAEVRRWGKGAGRVRPAPAHAEAEWGVEAGGGAAGGAEGRGMGAEGDVAVAVGGRRADRGLPGLAAVVGELGGQLLLLHPGTRRKTR